MAKIAFLLWGEIKYDGRVQKEIRTLRKNRFEVELIVSRFIDDNYENYPFKIHSLNFLIKKNQIKNFINKFIFCRQAFKVLKKIKPDIIHCNDLDTLYGGYLYKKFSSNSKIVYDSHELYPESQLGLKKFIWNVIERRLIKVVDEFILPEVNRSKYFKQKYGLNSINIIENFPEKIRLENTNYIELSEPKTKGKQKILYIGRIAKDRGAEEIVKAMMLIPEEFILIFIGTTFYNFKEKFLKFIRSQRLTDRIFIFDPVKNSDVIKYINSSDYGLVFYNDTNINNYYCASNKLFEFILCKKYLITNNYPGLIEVVEKNNYGICIEKVDYRSIANAILKIHTEFDNFKTTKEYLWDNLESSFVQIYS